jgi:hypothetical protein
MKPPPPALPQSVGLNLVLAVLGWLLGGFAYVVAAGLVPALAPRRAEGIREVVTMPWEAFSTLPTFIAIALGMTAGLLLPKTVSYRVAFVFGVAVAIWMANYCCVDLLRRAYIGKF